MSRIKSTFWVTAGLLSVFVMVTLPLGLGNSLKSGIVSVFRPFLISGAVTVNSIRRHSEAIFSYRGLIKENIELNQRLSGLERQIVELQEASKENERLRGLLSFKEKVDYNIIPGRVIGRDSSVWFSSILISKGRRSGIKENMPVLSQGGLAGRIIMAGPWVSRVMLITDINSRVGILVQDSREEALATGEGTDLLRLKYLSVDSELHPGDLVITSGLDGLFPKGLIVGNIIQIQPEMDGLTRTGLVKPAADLFRLEEVLCLDIKNGS